MKTDNFEQWKMYIKFPGVRDSKIHNLGNNAEKNWKSETLKDRISSVREIVRILENNTND